ncbi:hypothetical protein PPL_11820 [Heterostelium album PN500]|uniref:Uncharacterized protein n=1 Tax=Heterostelium pallidum (strain ATCC 26659 / Pp 5 / PN500) TaxID=670386 RepID=D3BUJ9_HETP5|nr:hypothetical protein PPL_11820 [Heterostelium album PN500]EFA74787.1 hypothetical protein PPL_11820 [Heterostelium album PN500]|eukprot:XP_020426921.1 hypothetical protein PPL_11820 [Heterostelium album PN500]
MDVHIQYIVANGAGCLSLVANIVSGYCPTTGADYSLYTINITNLLDWSVTPVAAQVYDGVVSTVVYQLQDNLQYTIQYTDSNNCTNSTQFLYTSVQLNLTQPLCRYSVGSVSVLGLKNSNDKFYLNGVLLDNNNGPVQVSNVGWNTLAIGKCEKVFQMTPISSNIPAYHITPYTYTNEDASIVVRNGDQYQSIVLVGHPEYNISASTQYRANNLLPGQYTLELVSAVCGIERIPFELQTIDRQYPTIAFEAVATTLDGYMNVTNATILNTNLVNPTLSFTVNGSSLLFPNLPAINVNQLTAKYQSENLTFSQSLKLPVANFDYTPISYEFTNPNTDICVDKVFNITISQGVNKPSIPLNYVYGQTTKYPNNVYQIQADKLMTMNYGLSEQIGSLNISGEEPKLIFEDLPYLNCMYNTSLFIPNFLHFKVLRVFVNIRDPTNPSYTEYSLSNYGLISRMPRGVDGYVLYQNSDCQNYNYLRRKNFTFDNFPLNPFDFLVKHVIERPASCAQNGSAHAEFYYNPLQTTYITPSIEYRAGDLLEFQFKSPNNIFGCTIPSVKYPTPIPPMYKPSFSFSASQTGCYDLLTKVQMTTALKIKKVESGIIQVGVNNNTIVVRSDDALDLKIVYTDDYSSYCTFTGRIQVPVLKVDPDFQYTMVTPPCFATTGSINVKNYQNYSYIKLGSANAVNGSFTGLDASSKKIDYKRNNSACINSAIVYFDVPPATANLVKVRDGSCINNNLALVDSIALVSLKFDNGTSPPITDIYSNGAIVRYNVTNNFVTGLYPDNFVIVNYGKCQYRTSINIPMYTGPIVTYTVEQPTCLVQYATIHLKSAYEGINLDSAKVELITSASTVIPVSSSYIIIQISAPSIPMNARILYSWNGGCNDNFYISVFSTHQMSSYILKDNGQLSNVPAGPLTINYEHRATSCSSSAIYVDNGYTGTTLDTSNVVVHHESCLGSYDGSIVIPNSPTGESYRLLEKGSNSLIQTHVNGTHTRFYSLTTGNYTLTRLTNPFCYEYATIEIVSTEPELQWDYSTYVCPRAGNGYITPVLNGNFIFLNFSLRVVPTQDYQYSSTGFTDLKADLYEVRGVINDRICQRNLKPRSLEIKTMDFQPSLDFPDCEVLKATANFPFKLGIYNIEAESTVFNSSLVDEYIQLPLTSGRYIVYFVSNISCGYQVTMQMDRCPGSAQARKNRNLAIGLGVGIGGAAVIGAAVAYIFYRKREMSSDINSSQNFKPVSVPMETIVIPNK